MSTEEARRDDIRRELEQDAAALGNVPPQDLDELAHLASQIAALPRHLPTDEEMEKGRGRLVESLQAGAGPRLDARLPILRAAAVLVMAVVLGLLALGGAFATGARLPQPVAVGPLSPFGSDRAEMASENRGRGVAEVARSGGGPGHGQEVRDAALGNRGQGGPDGDDSESGPGSTSAADKFQLVGALQQVSGDRVVVNGIAVLVTATTEIEGDLAVGVMVKVEGTLQADGTLVAREIEVQAAPGPAIPLPPLATPQIRIELRGRIESMTDSTFVVAGRTVHLTNGTEVKGRVRVGVVVKVEGTLQPDHSVLAREVEVVGTGGPGQGGGPASQPQQSDVANDRSGGRGGND